MASARPNSAAKAFYICESKGSDDATVAGTSEDCPLSTALRALQLEHSANPSASLDDVPIFVRKGPEAEFVLISAAARKKARKKFEIDQNKAKRDAERIATATAAAEAKSAEEKQRLIDAAAIVLVEDSTLPAAVPTKLHSVAEMRGKRIKVCGWVHNLRVQGKEMMFIVLRDGYGFLQCVLTGRLCQTFDAITMSTESTVEVYGTLHPVPEGKSAPGGHELHVDYWKLLFAAPSGDDAYASRLNTQSGQDVLLDQRHLYLRGKSAANVMRLRSHVVLGFRDFMQKNKISEVTPPLMVQTQVEGGSTLFEFNYYDQPAYLTQSSQLYLETMLPVLGDVYSIAESFRAEKSHTRRHLSQYTHVEGELGFITFDDLLDHIEKLVMHVVDYIMSDKEASAILKDLNPDFVRPTTPFFRMQYTEALEWLRTNEIKKEDGSYYVFGDDIPESPERVMIDKIGRPVFLCRFPTEIKSFYMKRDPEDTRLTESTDLLVPGVGEVVGGSMRMADYDELMKAYEREGIDSTPYYWYTDQRKYGSTEHGGYGLGLERFIAWLGNRYTVRECCMYPRYPGRCTP